MCAHKAREDRLATALRKTRCWEGRRDVEVHPQYELLANNQAQAAAEARRNREELDAQANAARIAAQAERQQEAQTPSEETPLIVELRTPKEPEGGRQYSAQEESELDRLAARLAPRIVQRIERSRNISVRRKRI